MATAKRTPKVSRISRDRTLVAYARKQKTPPEGGDGDGDDRGPDDDAPTGSNPLDKAGTSAEPALAATGAPGPASAASEPTTPPEPATAAAMPAAVTPEEPARARVSTVTMPAQASIGGPPSMPAGAAPIEGPVNVGSAEDPTGMPGPREIPGGSPEDPASPPGHVPPGDSRSMRRRTDQHEFALIYRIQTYVISRFGVVGTRGQWRVVEYPTSASASHAYAKECSRFVSEGFSDYRA
jgi:hypothetical protein